MSRWTGPMGFICLLLACCAHRPAVQRIHFLMDTMVRIVIYDAHMPEEEINTVIDGTLALMENLERRMSSYGDSSEITQLNTHAGRSKVQPSAETRHVLRAACEIGERTDGAFDITMGTVKALWHFESSSAAVPPEAEIASALRHVDFRAVIFADSSVMLRDPGMLVDLGGIAKGYIIDRAVAFLQSHGIRAGIVEAGGDLRIFGNHPFRPLWKIGIKHPRHAREGMLAVLETPPASIATSGDYERYFISDGVRYHHLLDPETGFPARPCVSVTICAPSALEADAYATAVFIAGPDRGRTLISEMPDLEGVIVWQSGEELNTWTSDGLLKHIEFQH